MNDNCKILYTFEKSYHISHNQDFVCCVGSCVNLYDIGSGELIYKFKDIKYPSCSKFTSNKTLIVKTAGGSYYIYDLVSMSFVKKILPPKNALGSTSEFQITADNKYIIDFSYSFPTKELVVIDIETGKYNYFNLGYCRKGFVFSTAKSSEYYVIANCAETNDAPDTGFQEYYELIYKSGKFKLQKLFNDSRGKLAIADFISNKFAIADYSNRISFFDAKKIFVDELKYEKNGILYDLKLSKDGRYIALAESQKVYIYNLDDKKCVKTYEVKNGCFVDFLDDTRLLVGTWNKGYCLEIG